MTDNVTNPSSVLYTDSATGRPVAASTSNPLPVTLTSGSTDQDVNIAAAGGVAVVAATAPVPVGFYNPSGGALIDPTLPAEVVGSVASGAADSGKPVKIGGVYNATPSALSEGQRGNIQLGSRGGVLVGTIANYSPADNVTNANAGGVFQDGNGNGRIPPVFMLGYNGTSWDRVRTAGSNLGLSVEEGPFVLGRATADSQIKGSAGFIHTVSIAPLTATPTAGLLTVYNSLTETGTVVYSEWIFATTPGHTVTLDIPCGTGIYVGFDATLANVQVTVAYR